MNYIPYRESKLTTLLKQSLGGNSFTLMIACLAPIDLYTEENISTLNYAARAAKISNAPSINMDPKMKRIMDQKRTIERLQQELKRANDQVKFLTMGGCSCKPEGGMANGHTSDSDILHQQSLKSDTSLTINNNYNNNNISIIDGSTITTTNGGQTVQQTPLVVPPSNNNFSSNTFTDIAGAKIPDNKESSPKNNDNTSYLKPDDNIQMMLKTPGKDGK